MSVKDDNGGTPAGDPRGEEWRLIDSVRIATGLESHLWTLVAMRILDDTGREITSGTVREQVAVMTDGQVTRQSVLYSMNTIVSKDLATKRNQPDARAHEWDLSDKGHRVLDDMLFDGFTDALVREFANCPK